MNSLYRPIYTCFLLPNVGAPCSIYIYSKDSYVEFIKRSLIITLQQITKLRLEHSNLAYIHTAENDEWNQWSKERFSLPREMVLFTDEFDQKGQVCLSKCLGHIQNFIKLKSSTANEQSSYDKALQLLSTLAAGPLLKWYFKKPPSEEIFLHNARVSFLISLFLNSYHDFLADAATLQAVVQFSLIHQLKENYLTPQNAISSDSTMAYIKENKIVLTEEIVHLLQLQDELFSGLGHPQRLSGDKIPVSTLLFSVVNHFDHYRFCCSSKSPQQKMEEAKKQMQERQKDFDPLILNYFLRMLKKIDIF